MFRDLKEYQEIQNLYANNVYLSEEEKQFIEVVKEAELTHEELQYFSAVSYTHLRAHET